jgi:hypothetical protein
MPIDDIFSQEFDDMMVSAMVNAREETLRAGVPVFYSDGAGGHIKETPDGRKYQIRFLPHAPGQANYEIVREIRNAA